MRLNFRKGQSSVEYSIIYSMGIVAIILALIVIWRMGAFVPGAPSEGRAGFSQVTVQGHSAQLNSSRLILNLRNDAGNDLEITGVYAGVDGIHCYNSSSITLSPGSNTLADLKCSGFSGSYVKGSYYKSNVTIDYANLDTGNMHKSKGKVWGGME